MTQDSYAPSFENLPARTRERLEGAFSSKTDSYGAYIALALACMNRGWSEQDYERILEESSIYWDYPYSARHHAKDVTAAWSKAEEYHDDRDAYSPENYSGSLEGQEEVRETLLDLAASPVVAGLDRNARGTVLAVIFEGYRRGAWTLDLSVRDIACLSGFGRQAVSNHLRRACDVGVLRFEERGFKKARRLILETDFERMGYKLGEVASVAEGSGHSWVSTGGEKVDRKSSSTGCYLLSVHVFPTPVFTRHGLGQTAYEIYRALLQHGEPVSIKRASELAGCDRKTARKYLDRMAQHGLIAERLDFNPRKFEAVEEFDLEDAAFLAGVDDSVVAMQQRHDIERELDRARVVNWVPGEAALPEDDNAELFELACRSGDLTPPDADDSLAPEPAVPQDPEPDVQSELLDALVAGDYSAPQDPGAVYPEGWDDFIPRSVSAHQPGAAAHRETSTAERMDVFALNIKDSEHILDPYVPEVEPAPRSEPVSVHNRVMVSDPDANLRFWTQPASSDPFADIDRVEDPFLRGAGDQPADPWAPREPVSAIPAPVDPFAACLG